MSNNIDTTSPPPFPAPDSPFNCAPEAPKPLRVWVVMHGQRDDTPRILKVFLDEAGATGWAVSWAEELNADRTFTHSNQGRYVSGGGVWRFNGGWEYLEITPHEVQP